jgi:hypothetical protein
MALDPQELANDILNDPLIMGDVPPVAQQKMVEIWTRLSVHITEQIKRGIIDDVQVDQFGNQQNISSVK